MPMAILAEVRAPAKYVMGDLQRGILECTVRTRGEQRGRLKTDTICFRSGHHHILGTSLFVKNSLSTTHLTLDERSFLHISIYCLSLILSLYL